MAWFSAVKSTAARRREKRNRSHTSKESGRKRLLIEALEQRTMLSGTPYDDYLAAVDADNQSYASAVDVSAAAYASGMTADDAGYSTATAADADAYNSQLGTLNDTESGAVIAAQLDFYNSVGSATDGFNAAGASATENVQGGPYGTYLGSEAVAWSGYQDAVNGATTAFAAMIANAPTTYADAIASADTVENAATPTAYQGYLGSEASARDSYNSVLATASSDDSAAVSAAGSDAQASNDSAHDEYLNEFAGLNSTYQGNVATAYASYGAKIDAAQSNYHSPGVGAYGNYLDAIGANSVLAQNIASAYASYGMTVDGAGATDAAEVGRAVDIFNTKVQDANTVYAQAVNGAWDNTVRHEICADRFHELGTPFAPLSGRVQSLPS